MSLRSMVRLGIGFTFALGLYSCDTSNPNISGPSSSLQEQLTENLQEQLTESERINLQSAQNSLTQAQNAYFLISADLLMTSTDVDSFRKLETEILPLMLATANSLETLSPSDEQKYLRDDFQSLFSDVATQMLHGINLNLSIYQGVIESPQSLGGNISVTQTLDNLGALFKATEYAERYSRQLAAFSDLLGNASTVRDSLRNQQAVIMNGVLRLSETVKESVDLKALYQTFAQTLTRPELLTKFSDLAHLAFGSENVALNKNELTSGQTNANLIQMVVREDLDRYRSIRIENGVLVNEIKEDSRGLSASDYLNQSNIVVVQDRSQS